MIPQALLQPGCFPPSSLQPYTPTVGPISYLVRLARLVWALLIGIPLVLWGGLLLALGVPALPAVEGRRCVRPQGAAALAPTSAPERPTRLLTLRASL
jgi:hypothetical protein